MNKTCLEKKRFCVIADDFTGAYDIGAQMKRQGITTRVYKKSVEVSRRNSIILDTETRALESKKAYDIVCDCIKKIHNLNYDIYFKKIDSFFRGNIVEELEAIIEELHFDKVIIAPSYPKMGRTVENGTFYLNKIDIRQTDLFLDPSNKNLVNNIETILKAKMKDSYIHLKQNEIMCCTKNYKVESYDAVTDKDLDKIVDKYWKTSKSVLWVGSIGLMNAILRKFECKLPILCVVGSVSSISMTQVEQAKLCGKKVISIDLNRIIEGKSCNKCILEAINYLKKGTDIILHTIFDSALFADFINIATESEVENRLMQYNLLIGQITYQILSRVEVAGILLTGGDTARSVLDNIGEGEAEILGELFPSTPIIRQSIVNNGKTNIVLKSGRVGNSMNLLECIDAVKEFYMYAKGENRYESNS